MNIYIKDRDDGFHTVNIGWIMIPIILLVLIAVLWGYQAVYTAVYDAEYNACKQAILSGKPTYTTNDGYIANIAFRRAAFCDPEVFVLAGNTVYSTCRDGRITYYFTYNNLLQNYYVHLAEYKARVQSVVDSMPAGLDDAGKIKWLHDYICNNYTYDYDLSRYDSYDMVTEGKGVCAAYAQLNRALLECAGIECHTAFSTNINHAWNIVKVNGQWRHIDVTWDDTESGVIYDYYLLDDAQLLKASPGRWDWIDCDKNQAQLENLRNAIYRYILPVWVICLLLCLIPIIRVRFFVKNKRNGKADGIASDADLYKALKNIDLLPPEEAQKLRDMCDRANIK